MEKRHTLFDGYHPVVVAVDFDGTVTGADVVDGVVTRFAQGGDWEKAEAEWAAGRIGSADCLKRQLECVRLERKPLEEHLKTVELDPGFKPLQSFLRGTGIPLVILSDGFDFFIRNVLHFHDVEEVPFRSNRLSIEGDRLIPHFPYHEQSCGRCGHCKSATMREYRAHAGHYVFVGDGLSDICALKEADTVFAKGKLEVYCRKSDIPYIAYRDLNDVTELLPEALEGAGEQDIIKEGVS